MRRWLSALGARLLPSRCPLCEASTGGDADLCAGCRGDLAANRPCCARCAEPLARDELACGRCLKRPPPFDAAFAVFRYAWPLDGLLTRFKFGGDLAAGRTLARLFADRARERAPMSPAWLVPVPLHTHRLRERGYDQALELARDIARQLDLHLAPDLVRRVKPTVAQTGLDAKRRRRNVRDAFALDAQALARLPMPRPAVALVDDVMTTGSTLAACAAVLRGAGFERVEAWAVARAPARR